MLERLESFVEWLVFSWYTSVTGRADVTRDSVLSDVSWLDLQDLCSSLPELTIDELDKMRVLSQVIHILVERLEKKGGAVSLKALSDLPRPGSVYDLEFSRQLHAQGELLDPGLYSGVDELKQFALVRRLYRESRGKFEDFWLKMTEKQQREACD